MKERIKQLLATILAVLLLVTLLDPLAATAETYKLGYDYKSAKYAKPGDYLDFNTAGSDGAYIYYCNYGTDINNISEADYKKLVIFRSAIKSGESITEDADELLLDFYDPLLNYSEKGLTDWLLIKAKKDYGKIYAIPLKEADVKGAMYVSPVVTPSTKDTFCLNPVITDAGKNLLFSDSTGKYSETFIRWHKKTYEEKAVSSENFTFKPQEHFDGQLYFEKSGDSYVVKGFDKYKGEYDNSFLDVTFKKGNAVKLLVKMEMDITLPSSGEYVYFGAIDESGYADVMMYRNKFKGNVKRTAYYTLNRDDFANNTISIGLESSEFAGTKQSIKFSFLEVYENDEVIDGWRGIDSGLVEVSVQDHLKNPGAYYFELKNDDTGYTSIMSNKMTPVVKMPTYSVSTKAVTGATVKTSVSKAQKGDMVTVTAKANDGYAVTAVAVTDANNKAVAVSKNSSGYYFTMPDSSVTVKAQVKQTPYVKVSADKITVCKGQTFDINKLVSKVASYDKVSSYKSNKTSVLTVNSKGIITAKKAGTAKITLISNKGAKASVTVTVGNKKIETSKITLANVENGKLTLKKSDKFTVKYKLNPITSQDKVTFTSSDTKVAVIDSKGKITPKKAGKATITVTSGKKKATFKLTVK